MSPGTLRVAVDVGVLVEFVGGSDGPWDVESLRSVVGGGLEPVSRLAVIERPTRRSTWPGAAWTLRGVTSNDRYVTRVERDALRAREEPLGRTSSNRAALIPISKSEAWWELAQDERRRIFEESSRHIANGLRYLPAVARRLHHGRDLGEPFDFLTWFEFAERDAPAFDELVATLRATEEWTYVVREVDIRLALERR